MQYTSSSFAEIIVGLFAGVLRPKRDAPHVDGLFPRPARFYSPVPEVVLDLAVLPAMRLFGRGLAWFRWVQRGTVQLYILYVLATLVVLLVVWR